MLVSRWLATPIALPVASCRLSTCLTQPADAAATKDPADDGQTSVVVVVTVPYARDKVKRRYLAAVAGCRLPTAAAAAASASAESRARPRGLAGCGLSQILTQFAVQAGDQTSFAQAQLGARKATGVAVARESLGWQNWIPSPVLVQLGAAAVLHKHKHQASCRLYGRL